MNEGCLKRPKSNCRPAGEFHVWGQAVVWRPEQQSHLRGHLLRQGFELGAVRVLIRIFEHLVGDPYGAAVHPLDPHIFTNCRITQTRLNTHTYMLTAQEFTLLYLRFLCLVLKLRLFIWFWLYTLLSLIFFLLCFELWSPSGVLVVLTRHESLLWSFNHVHVQITKQNASSSNLLMKISWFIKNLNACLFQQEMFASSFFWSSTKAGIFFCIVSLSIC